MANLLFTPTTIGVHNQLLSLGQAIGQLHQVITRYEERQDKPSFLRPHYSRIADSYNALEALLQSYHAAQQQHLAHLQLALHEQQLHGERQLQQYQQLITHCNNIAQGFSRSIGQEIEFISYFLHHLPQPPPVADPI